MFKETAVCPKNEEKTGAPCEGYREKGILRNQCAYCQRYKEHVKIKFPEVKGI